ncbi:MAG TPA: ATP-grasp ribosomal peptide maturase [Jiangellaceae bacterium]
MIDDRAVLVVTSSDDPTADLVIAELHRRGVPVTRLDPGADFPAALSASARIETCRRWSGMLTTPTRTASLNRIRSLYYRRPSGFGFPHLDPQDARFATTQARYGLGGVLASLSGCLYVNHPHRIGDAEFKPAGLAAAAAAGLNLPATLVTNVADDARAFVKEHVNVVYKPLWVPPYVVDGVSQTIPVDMVDADELDDSIAGSMHLFQALVDKIADVRATVIGDRVFAVRIDSGLLDWRTDYGTHTYTVVDTPAWIEAALRAYLRTFGLAFGAFDFCIDRSGNWIFLECNASGQWAWLEPPTGLPLTATLADVLERGRS